MEKVNKVAQAAIMSSLNNDLKIRITKKKGTGSKKMKSSSVKTLQTKKL